MRRNRPDPLSPDHDLLDLETWDAPKRLSVDDCLIHTGPDWHWTTADRDDPEDDR